SPLSRELLQLLLRLGVRGLDLQDRLESAPGLLDVAPPGPEQSGAELRPCIIGPNPSRLFVLLQGLFRATLTLQQEAEVEARLLVVRVERARGPIFPLRLGEMARLLEGDAEVVSEDGVLGARAHRLSGRFEVDRRGAGGAFTKLRFHFGVAHPE